jgi:hypothetical protein
MEKQIPLALLGIPRIGRLLQIMLATKPPNKNLCITMSLNTSTPTGS